MRPCYRFGCLLLIALLLVGCSQADDPALEHFRWAQHYVSKNKITEAKAEVNEAIAWHPAQYSMYVMAISIFNPKKYPKEAIHYASELENRIDSARLDRKLNAADKAELYSQIGTTYWDARSIHSAEMAFDKALSASPNDPMLMNNLGYFYADEGIKLNLALKLTRRAAKLAPKEAMIIDSLGWTYYKLGRYKSAVSQLKKAVDLAPDEADLRYHLGAAYLKSGRRSLARIELRKALLLNPSHHMARKLLRNDRGSDNRG